MAEYKQRYFTLFGNSRVDTIPNPVSFPYFTRIDEDSHREYYSNGTSWIEVNKSLFPSRGLKYCLWTGSHPNSSSGEGMAFYLSSIGTGNASGIDTDGKYVEFHTDGTLLANCGLRSGTPLTWRQFNPRVSFRYKLNQTSDINFWAGLGGSNEPTGNNYLNSRSGVLFGIYTANNTIGPGSSIGLQIAYNDGDASAPTPININVTADTLVHRVDMYFIDSTPQVLVYYDNTLVATLTTDIPAQQTNLYPMLMVEATTAFDKPFKGYYYEMEHYEF